MMDDALLEVCLRRIYSMIPNQKLQEESEDSAWLQTNQPVCDLESEY